MTSRATHSVSILSCVRRTLALFSPVLFGCLCAPGTQATMYIIEPDGTGDFPTIQVGLTVAVDGDTIALASGTFYGSGNHDLDFGGKAIVLRSLWGAPQGCTIDCGGQGRGILFNDNEPLGAVVEGITITGGSVGNGSGIRCNYNAHPTIRNCILRNNEAEYGAGLMLTDTAHPLVEACEFIGNHAVRGGGAYSTSGHGLILSRCEFYGNSAEYGGGVFCEDGSRCEVLDCSFFSNFAMYNGGGLQCTSVGDGILQDCVFAENEAENKGGGAFFVQHTRAVIRRCTFWANGAVNNGGGVGFYDSVTGTLDNTIICESSQGEALYCPSSCTAELACCDLYANAGGDWIGPIAEQLGVQGNIQADPLLCDPEAGDFNLQEGSPCAPEQNPTCGLIGAGPVGCDSIPAPTIYVVRPDGTGDFPTIQAALSSCFPGDVVELADGVFEGHGNRDIQVWIGNITIRSQSNDPEACFLRCDGSASERHRAFVITGPVSEGIRVAGIGMVGGYAIASSGSDGRGGAVLCTEPGLLEFVRCRFADNIGEDDGGAVWAPGATFRYCTFSNNESWERGGGIYSTSDLTVLECSFSENGAEYGGGFLCAGGSTVVDRSVFTANAALTHGGGLHCTDGDAALADCRFEGNEAGERGGGVRMSTNTSLEAHRCWFSANMATIGGGGLSSSGLVGLHDCTFDDNASLTGRGGAFDALGTEFVVEGSIFFDNLAPEGGAISSDGPFGALTGCTLDNNRASLGAGLWVDDGLVEVQNTIISFSSFGAAVHCASGYSVSLDCCDIFGNVGGDYVGCIDWLIGMAGNISADPLYFDREARDYGLQEGSPCAPFTPPNPECDLIGAEGVGSAFAGVAVGPVTASRGFELGRARPNPFSALTRLSLTVEAMARGPVRVGVFDAGGRLVRHLFREETPTGRVDLVWDGCDEAGRPVPCGVFYCRARGPGGTVTRPILLVR